MKTERISDPAASQIPSRWHGNFRQLQAIRDGLLSDSADQIAEFKEPLETPGIDVADSATDEFDHVLALGLLAHEEDALFEVDAAIQRILNGTYGVCELTGKSIPEARLRAVPWTRYTREALTFLERQGLIHGPELEEVESLQGRAPGGLAVVPDPEAGEPIALEVRRRRREQGIHDLAGDTDLSIDPSLNEPS